MVQAVRKAPKVCTFDGVRDTVYRVGTDGKALGKHRVGRGRVLNRTGFKFTSSHNFET